MPRIHAAREAYPQHLGYLHFRVGPGAPNLPAGKMVASLPRGALITRMVYFCSVPLSGAAPTIGIGLSPGGVEIMALTAFAAQAIVRQDLNTPAAFGAPRTTDTPVWTTIGGIMTDGIVDFLVLYNLNR